MAMANTATTSGFPGAPIAQLKTLLDQVVTLTTARGEVTGVVLSCTRLSVWLVVDDDDVVVALADITSLHRHGTAAAA